MNEQECQAKGGKLVDGKCEMPNVVPSTSGFKSKKKSNNPFRMWGSWIGLGSGIFIIYGLSTGLIPLPGVSHPNFNELNKLFVFGIPSLTFLIGWGINVLYRRYKK